jgi:NADPH-dependent curcumin reductase CurA
MTVTRAIRVSYTAYTDVSERDFEVVETAAGEPQEGELAITALIVSVDPYLMMPIRQGAFPGGIMRSRIIARVEQSRAEGFAPGDLVLGFSRWQERDCVPAAEMRKLSPVIPLTNYLGVAGHSGFTAMLGIDILDPGPGQTVTVDSAAGMVGSVACQLAKAAGARVVAIAGGDKARQVKDLYGLDAAVNRAAPDFETQLAAACPDGIDRHFENVGAKILDPVLGLANVYMRVALCGLIQHYGDDEPVALRNFRKLLNARVNLQAFSIYEHDDAYPAALVRLEGMVKSGALIAQETIHEGFAAIPPAFIKMLSGQGIGKHLVKVAD